MLKPMSGEHGIRAARESIDASNAQDHERLAARLNYPPNPHIRLARTFARFENAEEYVELSRRGEAHLQQEGWDHTEIASIEAIQMSDDKVHLVMQAKSARTGLWTPRRAARL